MVAFASSTELLHKSLPRARAQHRTCSSPPSRCSKSNQNKPLRQATYKTNTRLGSCSKDPMGYRHSTHSYASSISQMLVDPYGNHGGWEPMDPRIGGPHPRVLLPPSFDPDPPAAPAPPVGGCHSYILVGHAGNVFPSIGNIQLPDCYRVGGICCFMNSTQTQCQSAYPHTFPVWPMGTGNNLIYRHQYPLIFRNRAGPRRQALRDACNICGCTQSSLTHLCDDDATQGIRQHVRAGRMVRNWCAFTMNMNCRTGRITFSPNRRRLPWQPGVTRNWPVLPPNWPWRPIR